MRCKRTLLDTDPRQLGKQCMGEHTAPTDLAATPIIAALQQAGPFSNVNALPGRDPKSVMFQMNVPAK